MDADNDEQQLKLQRASSELIEEVKQSLPHLLWKSSGSVRRLVRNSKTKRLIGLLEPFQEEPQLLDRHMGEMIAPLVEAFTSFLTRYLHDYGKIDFHSLLSDVCPLPRAICSILYTFSKIRGHKIVLRFFSTQPQLLDPMLSAFELWNGVPSDDFTSQATLYNLSRKEEASEENTLSEHFSGGTTWEEKYIMILWIYHLAGVPFDLTLLSSEYPATTSTAHLVPFQLPSGCPVIVKRLVAVACQYLGKAGREREAAVHLLTRLALLADWHKIGLHRHIIEWALSKLLASVDKSELQPDYTCMSLLAFLANFVSLATSALLEPFVDDLVDLARTIQATHRQSPADAKLLIKFYRNLALQSIDFRNQAVELATTHLIDQLSANNTVIRLAASKALARMVILLDPEMVTDLVGHLLDGLETDVNPDLLNSNESRSLQERDLSGPIDANKYYLEKVNASNWHGLTMALSHLIYQHSVPGSILVATVDKLIIALHFHQTNALGSLIGSNVRDAACFGFWALARKYNTLEVTQASSQCRVSFQALANELVVAALLDPVGNVRRAASAALQEMIGRHPDTIDCGHDLKLVRAIDYHAVTSKAKATKAAVSVIEMETNYWACILQGLLSWRGARFEDNGSRQKTVDEIQRSSALLISNIADQHRSTRATLISAICHELEKTKFSKIAQRKGLIYALAGVVSGFFDLLNQSLPLQGSAANEQQMINLHGTQIATLRGVLERGVGVPLKSRTQAAREIEAIYLGQVGQYLRHWISVAPIGSTQDAYNYLERLSDSLNRLDEGTATVNGRAIREILLLLQAQNDPESRILEFLTDCIEKLSSAKGFSRFGLLASLSGGILLPSVPEAMSRTMVDILVEEALGQNVMIESRTLSLNLMRDNLVRFDVCPACMIDAFEKCLDDYTIDKQKGDVGQHVRAAAISAIDLAISRRLLGDQTQRESMIAKICELAMDKVGGVRLLAVTFMMRHWEISGLAVADLPFKNVPEMPKMLVLLNAEMDPAISISFFDAVLATYETSQVNFMSISTHFEKMLALTRLEWARFAILEGFLVTAGSECEGQFDSRMAFINHVDHLSDLNWRLFWFHLISVLQHVSYNDRLLIPAMEVIGFLFDSGTTLRLEQEGSGYWAHLSDLVTDRRFRSTNIHKLQAAIRIYCGLAKIEDVQINRKASTELCKMLQHPYPVIRNAAADAVLLTTSPSSILTQTNWKHSVKQNSDELRSIKKQLGIAE